ncbi:hypothetical protein OAP14_02470 [Aliiglaciecola sp.]|nr:hypothetical protein [Aliiglaciecola sp.]
MYDLRRYLSLSSECKGLSANLWALQIMRISGQSSPEMFCKQLGITHPRAGLKPRMMRQKLKGEPIKQLSKVKLLEDIYPGTAKLLVHPLWELLDNPQLNMSELLSLTSRLPFAYQERLLDKKHNDFKPKDDFKLLAKSDVDGLCALLIKRRVEEIKLHALNDSVFDMAATKLILRMFAVTYPKALPYGFRLINSVSRFFTSNKSNGHYLTVVPLSLGKSTSLESTVILPIYIQQLFSLDVFSITCSCYKQILDAAKLKFPTFVNEQNQLAFLALLKHFSLKQIANQLANYDEESLTRLNMNDELLKHLVSLKNF